LTGRKGQVQKAGLPCNSDRRERGGKNEGERGGEAEALPPTYALGAEKKEGGRKVGTARRKKKKKVGGLLC